LILRFLLFTALLCFPWSSGRGQSRVGEWRHYTSTIKPQAIAYYEGRVYMATGGGVLVYDPVEDAFSTLAIVEGLDYTDLSCFAICGEWLWLGGAAPRGILQIVHLPTGRVEVVDLDLDAIYRIVALEDRAFAAFQQDQDFGIMELRWDGQSYSFTDTYRNFPFTVNDILDLDLGGDSLFVTTSAGVLGNNYVQANLKDPLTWNLMTPPGVSDIVQYLVDSTGHYFLVPYELQRRTVDGWELVRAFGLGTLSHLARRPNGAFVITHSRHLVFIAPNSDLFVSQEVGGIILAYVDGEGEDEGYAIIRDQGLAHYHHSTRDWTPLPPNTMAWKSYTAILKLSTGELVAAGLRGITRFNGQSWYNLLPGYYSLTGPEDTSGVNGNAQVVSSRFFLADTIYFRGKQSWNLLELPDGDILVGFKGNPPEGGGILRVNFDDVAGYEKYDTTDGHLDGLSSDGFITIRHMAMDQSGNVWIANPFCELRENVLAVYKADGDWAHFSTYDSRNSLNLAPTEIAFDAEGRVWIGSQVNAHWRSTGGIAVLDYGGTLGAQSSLDTLEGKADDHWAKVAFKLEADHSNTVWSLVFDRHNVLWTVSPNGVMGYYVEPDLTLTRFTQFGPYLSDIPFVEGSKIRVDAQNNKWITTPQYGLWVLLENTTFWPSVEGINSRNSSLTSDEILDIYLDDDEGMAYLATSKGISALKIPFKRELDDYNEMVIFPSPYRIPSNKELIVDGLRQGSTVKIFTVTGRLVKELTAQKGGVQGYQALWDGRNAAGEWVGSGVYLITAYLESGRSGIGKVAVIRR